MLFRSSTIAIAYSTSGWVADQNGAAPIAGSASALPSATQFYIGLGSNGVGKFNGYYKKLAYYPKRLANATLQALTA